MFRKFNYLLALFLLSFTGKAQNPGGVNTNLSLWIKSNSGTSTTTNGNPLASWIYANDGAKSFTGAPGEQPTFTSSAINFLPAITFNGTQMMDGPVIANAPIPLIASAGDDDYCYFIVWASTSATPSVPQRIWSQRNTGASNDGTSLWIYSGNYGNQAEIGPFTQGCARPYTTGAWNISQINLLAQNTNDLEVYDDRNLSSGPLVLSTDPGNNAVALRNLDVVLNRLGARNVANEEAFIGSVAEVIVYTNPVSSAERQRVFSYLAMKYGVTIKTNITAASGAVIWNATSNSTYNNAVFGIAKDDASGLLVSQSNSIETGSGDGTGQNGKANIYINNASSLDDQDFLMIGNDNVTLAESTTNLPIVATGSQRLQRQWKVQHTGNAGTVSMHMDLTGLTITGSIGTTSDFRIMVDEDGDGDFSTGNVRFYKPTSFTGNVANFNGVTLNNGEIFTLITKTNTPILPVTWTSVSASLVNNNVKVSWSVENNTDAIRYEVEHSANGIQFGRVGVVTNIGSQKNYSYTHSLVSGGMHYYRVHQFDITGASTYSKIVSVNIQNTDFLVHLISNPVSGNAALMDVNVNTSGDLAISLVSINGLQVQLQQQHAEKGTLRVAVPLDKIPAGNYLIKVSMNGKTQSLPLVRL